MSYIIILMISQMKTRLNAVEATREQKALRKQVVRQQDGGKQRGANTLPPSPTVASDGQA